MTATERLVVAGGEISTEATGAGAAGAITVNAGRFELRNGGLIHSDAERGGAAGSVGISADRLLAERGEVSTNSASEGGGSIRLQVGGTVVLHNSAITTSVRGGTDPTAGKITIDPEVLVIDNSRIQANAPAGFGGKVRIAADNILVPGGDFDVLLERGDISASGGDPTRNGTIVVNAPEVDLSGGLIILQGSLLDAASLLRERCAARRDVSASSFTGVGRAAALPPTPDAPLAGGYTSDAPDGRAPLVEPAAAPTAKPSRAGLTRSCQPWG